MRKILFALLLAVLWLLPAPARPAPSALPPPGRIPDGLGVNIHFTGAPARDLDGLQQGGFRWARMDFVWDAIEKQKGVYDFAAYDALVAGLDAHGMRPLFILDYGNDLYEKGAPRSPSARAAFARFAAAAVTHYRGKRILWEIWNEPNGGFWQPQANVEEYGSLALATAQAIRAADPGATVLAPGTSTLPLPFFESLFKRGLLRYIDAVSFHPYRGGDPETAAADYAQLRQMIAKYAPSRDVPLVSSEWGYNTVDVSEKTQAQYLTRQWLFNIAEGIRVSIWYDWHDDGTDPKYTEHHFGTVNNDDTPKPAYLAAQALTRALAGCTFVKRLPLGSDQDYLLLFRSGKGVKLAAWTTGDAHTVPVPLAGPTRALSLLDGTARVLPASKAVSVTLSGSPQALEPSPAAAASLLRAADWTARAKNPSYGSGQPPAIAVSYANGDAAPHRVQFAADFDTPGQTQTIAVSGPSAPTSPGQAVRQTLATARLSRVPVRARVTLILDGRRQPFPQDVVWTPTDPLRLSVAPGAARGFTVQIENPAATAFTGSLTAQAVLAAGNTRRPVRIGAGQKTVGIDVPGDATRPTSWTLRDASGRALASLPAQRFAPYPVQWAKVQAIKDGDPKLAWDVHAAPAAKGDSLTVAYKFVPGWTFWRAAETAPGALPGRPAALGLWVTGDGSGNLVRMRFRDATGQTFQPDGGLMDWTGPRWVTFPLAVRDARNVGHWGGAKDGVIHFPITIDTLLLLDSPGASKSPQGVITLRRPSLIYDEK